MEATHDIGGDSPAFGHESAIGEAHALYRMLDCAGNTVEAIRELIAVPPHIEQVLRAFIGAHPAEA